MLQKVVGGLIRSMVSSIHYHRVPSGTDRLYSNSMLQIVDIRDSPEQAGSSVLCKILPLSSVKAGGIRLYCGGLCLWLATLTSGSGSRHYSHHLSERVSPQPWQYRQISQPSQSGTETATSLDKRLFPLLRSTRPHTLFIITCAANHIKVVRPKPDRQYWRCRPC